MPSKGGLFNQRNNEMKYLEYDELTGDIRDATGLLVTTMHSFKGIEIKESSSVDDLCKLKNAGFTAEEMIDLKRKELI